MEYTKNVIATSMCTRSLIRSAIKKRLSCLLCLASLVLISTKTVASDADEIVISKDNELLAVTYTKDDDLNVFSLETGEIVMSAEVPDDYINNLEFVPSKSPKYIEAHSDDYRYRWNLTDGSFRQRANTLGVVEAFQLLLGDEDFYDDDEYDDEYGALLGQKDERWVIQDDDVISIRSVGKDDEKARIRLKDMNLDEIEYISISPKGNRAALSVSLESNEYKVLIMDTRNYAITSVISPLSKVAYKTHFLSNNRLLIESGYPLEVWNIKRNKKILSFNKQGSFPELSLLEMNKMDFKPFELSSSINGLDVNPTTGNVIVTGTAYPLGAVEINPQGKLVNVFQNIYSNGYDARYSPDGKLAAFAYHGEHVLVFNVDTGELDKYYDIGGVPNGTRILKFSADSRYLAAGSDGGAVIILDMKEKEIVNAIDVAGGVFSLQWLNNDKLLVGTLLQLFELTLSTGEQRPVLDDGTIALDAYINDDGTVESIVVGREDNSILLLNGLYDVVGEYPLYGVGRISFTNDGSKVVAIDNYDTHIWDFTKGTTVACTDNHDYLWAMAFDKSNELIYSAGDGGRVYVMDMNCKLLN